MKKILILLFFIAFSSPVFGDSDFGTSIVKIKSGPSASFVIAKSDSKKKNFADYVCDGTDDQVQINAALNALAATTNGGKIVLLEGTYNVSAPVTIPSMTNGTITIEGQGALNTTIYASSGSNTNVVQTNITSGNQTFVIVRDLMINGNRSGNPSGGRGYYDGVGTGQCMDTLFEHVFFYNLHGNCVEMKQCWGSQFKRCILEDSDSKGIYLISGTDARIEGGKFIHILGNAIESNAAATEISKNIIFMAGASSVGINVTSGANYSLVLENQIHHDTEIVSCVGIQSAAGHVVISNNQVESATSTATASGIILTAASSYSSGTGNIIDISASGKFSDSGTKNAVSYNSSLASKSGVIANSLIVTAPYQMLNTDDTVVGNLGTPFAVTLPASPEIGQKVSLFNAGAGTITLYGSGAATINGSATKTINSLTGYIVQYIYTNNWIAW